MPDLGWLQKLLPNEEQWQDFRGSLITAKNTVADKIEIGKHDKYMIVYVTWKREATRISYKLA